MAPTKRQSLTPALAKDIIRLWKDPKFPGAFLGVKAFQQALKRVKKIEVSYKDLLLLMLKEPNYIRTIRPARRFPRRRLKVHGYGVLMQADLAIMPTSPKGFNCFLLCVDAFSRKVFCRPQKGKTAQLTKESLQSIFEDMGLTPITLETDDGGEFKGNKKWLQNTKKVFWKAKYGRNKAFLAERSISLIKRRLYRLLRTHRTDQWDKYLSDVVASYNKTPQKVIGGLRPEEIKSPLDDPLIDDKIGHIKFPSLKTMLKRQAKYEADESKLQVGQYVYADEKEHVFDKSFDEKRRQLFKIRRVLAEERPVLYYLEDLKGEEVPRAYYAQELHLTKAPREGEFFDIEKVLDTRLVNGKKQFKVKFKGYPNKYNQWVDRLK